MKFRDFITALRNWLKSFLSRSPSPPSLPSVQTPSYSIEHVWTGPSSTYKLVGLLGTPYGLVVTTCNVCRGTNRSKIFRDFTEVYSGSQETIGQPFLCGDVAIFPVEHGSHHLLLDDTRVRPGAQTHGRWSVAGGMFQGFALLAYNNAYGAGRRFTDEPVLVNALTGKVHATLPVKAMPRCLVEHKRKLYASHNFGDCGVTVLDNGTLFANVVQIASFNGRLYGGESAAWGPAASPSTAGGKITRLDGNTFVEVFDTGCSCIAHMAALGGRLWIAGIDPDRLYVMNCHERFTLVAELPGETPADKARSFGGAVAWHDNSIYWGRSDRNNPHVYKVIEEG